MVHIYYQLVHRPASVSFSVYVLVPLCFLVLFILPDVDIQYQSSLAVSCFTLKVCSPVSLSLLVPISNECISANGLRFPLSFCCSVCNYPCTFPFMICGAASAFCYSVYRLCILDSAPAPINGRLVFVQSDLGPLISAFYRVGKI